jgi:hypothetical protein
MVIFKDTLARLTAKASWMTELAVVPGGNTKVHDDVIEPNPMYMGERDEAGGSRRSFIWGLGFTSQMAVSDSHTTYMKEIES